MMVVVYAADSDSHRDFCAWQVGNIAARHTFFAQACSQNGYLLMRKFLYLEFSCTLIKMFKSRSPKILNN